MPRQTMADLQAQVGELAGEIRRLNERLDEARQRVLRLEASLGLVRTVVEDALEQ